MNVSAEIAELWSAGTPIVYLVTSEEERAVVLCRAAAAAFDARAGVWSSHRGLEPLAPAAKDPSAFLDAVLKAPAPFLAIGLDFHLALENPALARYAELGRLLAGTGKAPATFPHDGEARAALVQLLDDWRARLAVPRLSAYGITAADIPAIVADSRGSSMKTNPIVLTDSEIAAILAESL